MMICTFFLVLICETSAQILSVFYNVVACFNVGTLFYSFFDSEYGGDMFLRNVGSLTTDYTALYTPGDSTLFNNRCENLKTYINNKFEYRKI
jgi:hypothetical protein